MKKQQAAYREQQCIDRAAASSASAKELAGFFQAKKDRVYPPLGNGPDKEIRLSDSGRQICGSKRPFV
jgi:hypothetical protein